MPRARLLVFFLQCYDIFSGRSLRTVNNLKAYTSTFFQGFIAVSLDGGKVNKDVTTVILSDKTIPFRRVKPFYRAFFHCCYSLKCGPTGTLNEMYSSRFPGRMGRVFCCGQTAIFALKLNGRGCTNRHCTPIKNFYILLSSSLQLFFVFFLFHCAVLTYCLYSVGMQSDTCFLMSGELPWFVSGIVFPVLAVLREVQGVNLQRSWVNRPDPPACAAPGQVTRR